MKMAGRWVGTLFVSVLLKAWDLAERSIGICFVLLFQVDQVHDLIALEATCTRGYVIRVQVPLKTCMGGLRIPDCLSRLTRLFPVHSRK